MVSNARDGRPRSGRRPKLSRADPMPANESPTVRYGVEVAIASNS